MKNPATALAISPDLLAQVESHARGSYPEECCGILIGAPGGRGSEVPAKVTALWPAANVEAGDRRQGYAIAPERLLQAHKRARSRGCEVIGYYHSHPGASAVPSDRDLAEAVPGVSYLIIAVRDREVLERRSWRLRSDHEGFQEERLI